MKSTELRIGNIIRIVNHDNHCTVTELKQTNSRVTYIRSDTGLPHTSLVGYTDLEPIPLSPEILNACGFNFVKALRKYCISTDEIRLRLEYAGHHCQIVEDGYFGMPFQYLHQLQNLFFALTGQELEVKL